MGGFFGATSRRDVAMDVFFGVDYHSHLGTRSAGMIMWDRTDGFQRQIHSIANAPFRTKFEKEMEEFLADVIRRQNCNGLEDFYASIGYGGVQLWRILPKIKEALTASGKDVKIIVDCGITSGADVYKCLALGATAVSVGRHLMPLLKEGADKTAGRIKEMTGELAATMARTGVKDLKSFDPTVIHKRSF